MKIKTLIFLMIILMSDSCQTEKLRLCSSEEGNNTPLKIGFNRDKIKNLKDSTYVKVYGYFLFQLENIAIFPSKSDATSRDLDKALWVQFTSQMVEVVPEEKLEELSGEYVTIEGYLYPKENGHLEQYIGTIEAVCIGK